MTDRTGTITVLTGPMAAGKTTRLLLERANDPGRIYSPRADVRERVTHDGRPIPCVIVDSATDILREVVADDERAVRDGCVAYRAPVYIDEAQFFCGDLLSVVRELSLMGHDVTLAGLSLTYQGAPFGPLPLIMCEADRIITLRSTCTECGAPAMYTDRIGATLEGGCGGLDCYAPRCRRHWRGGCF